MLIFHAATLDNPGLFKPQKILWSASKQPWDYLDPGLERLWGPARTNTVQGSMGHLETASAESGSVKRNV